MSTRFDDSAADAVYEKVWGGHIHFGIYTRPDASFDAAIFSAKARVAALAAAGAGSTVLEVGCGYGGTAAYLAKNHGVEVIASNLSLTQLVRTSPPALAARSPRFVAADYHDLPFRAGAFDAHISQEALVYARDKPRVFAEAWRVLKPGGRLVFTEQTTRAAALSGKQADILAERHGNRDFWDGDRFCCAIEAAGFDLLGHEDLTPHMARHFDNLVRRLDRLSPSLSRPDLQEALALSRERWSQGREMAAAGRIGWAAFAARKP